MMRDQLLAIWNFWLFDVFQGYIDLAFVVSLVVLVFVIGLPFRWMVKAGERSRRKAADQALQARMAESAGLGASSAQIEHMAEMERRRARADALYIPPIQMRMAARPVDQTYFETLRRFADDKLSRSEACNDYERLAAGPLGFVADILDAGGGAFLDDMDVNFPFRTREVQSALRQIGATELVDVMERFLALAARRHELMRERVAIGADREVVLKGLTDDSYAPLVALAQSQGGRDKLVFLADRYFEAAYPWAA